MVRKTCLDNGITVLSERMEQFLSCSLGIWVKAGSRFETPAQSGISHCLEHMLFKGTERRTAVQIAEEMDAVGGQLNAFTEKEHTCFYARVVDKHLPIALDVLFDMFLHSQFALAELEREKSVILEEISMCEDSPEEVVFDMFYSSLWPNHPLGRPILGSPEVVSSITPDDLRHYMEQCYGGRQIMVVAAGNVDHEQLVQYVQDCCGGLPAGPELDSCPGGRPQPALGKLVKYRDSEQVQVCYGVQGFACADERRYAVHVLDSVLGGSMSCRLFQEIREKQGLAYTVGTFLNSYRDCGNIGIYAGTSSEKVDEVLRLSRAIVADVVENGITERELVRAREHIKGTLALGMESTSARMLRLARSESYYGRFMAPEEFLQGIDRVEHGDVVEVARTLFQPDNFRLVVLGPVLEVDGVKAEEAESLQVG